MAISSNSQIFRQEKYTDGLEARKASREEKLLLAKLETWEDMNLISNNTVVMLGARTEKLHQEKEMTIISGVPLGTLVRTSINLTINGEERKKLILDHRKKSDMKTS